MLDQLEVAVAEGHAHLDGLVGLQHAHPGQLDGALRKIPFPFHVTCVIHPQGGRDRTVVDKDYRVSADKPVTVSGIPAGADCKVWETSALGGVAARMISRRRRS
ncbi:DUF5979 domain-containing protein [Streptomyces sp. NPDC051561]|uniref:DUF5979 domain-containing protein n=1 Tax=Streptomyces sp. NPDC051561 TaxID=3365658 RepID=UPI0037A39942